MRVLSLFDGMACGVIAMQLAGVDVESYDAYEIDKYAVKTAQHNFPMIQEHGDVFTADFTQYEGVDFLVGGSPCTYWSIAQTKNRETVASGMGWELFSQYVRALREAKPKYFIYENNKSMSKQIRASIDEAFGFEAVLINSALVSAQNRQRLYWVGRRNADGTYSKVNVEQPEDRGILLKDVLDSAVAMREKGHAVIAIAGRTTEREYFIKNQGNMAAEPINTDANWKSFCLTSRYHKGFGNNPGKCLEKHRDSMVAEPVNCTADGKSQTIKAQYQQTSPANICCYTSTYGASGVAEPICVAQRGKMYRGEPQHYEARDDGKTNTLTSVEKDNRVAEPLQIGRMPREDGIVTDSKQYRVYSTDGKAVTQCGQGGGLGAKTGLYAIPAMPVREATTIGYTDIECGDCVDLSMPNSKTRRGRNMADKSNCMQTSNEFYQYVGYAIEFDDDGKPIKAIGKDGKQITVYEVREGKITIKGKQYPIKLKDGYYIIRKLTVTECKRLQTVPEWYDFSCVSNSQAYKMLGNGWTCEVIKHLIDSCLNEKETDFDEQCRWF